MNNGNWLLKAFKATGLALIMGVSFTACGAGKSSWKEEVLLQDGSKIIVERSVDRGGRHEIGQQPPIKEQSFTFAIPKTNESITWKSGFSEDIGLADFQPLLLDISSDTAYVVTHPVGCLSYNKWGRPNPPYIVFKYEGKVWTRIAIQELPADIKTPNMIFSSPDSTVKKLGTHFVKAEMVQEINSSLTQPEFKTILREPIKAGALGTDGSTVNCEVMVRFEDGWAGPDYVEMVKRNNFQLQKELERRRLKAAEPN